jgi:hypothetical protein
MLTGLEGAVMSQDAGRLAHLSGWCADGFDGCGWVDGRRDLAPTCEDKSASCRSVCVAPPAYPRPAAACLPMADGPGDVGTSHMDGVVLGRAHGVANLIGGLWPLLHISSFEMVFGPKTDRWLVKTVAGLLMVNGLTQLTTSSTADGVRQARRLGVGTAAVLAAIDLVYVPAGRISKMYLVDAALEVGWILAWCRVDKPTPWKRQQFG